MGAQNGPKSWVNIVGGNKLTARGMPLKYVAPIIKDGKKVVQLTKADVELETKKWRNSIILYVVGESPTIVRLKRFIAF